MHYYTTDHFGSVRLVTDAGGNILEQFDYLPYGDRCINSNLAVVNTGKTDYLYGGKELPQLFGIDWFDSVARWQTTFDYNTVKVGDKWPFLIEAVTE